MENQVKKPFYKDGTFWCAIVSICLTLWFVISCVVGCSHAQKKNNQEVSEVVTTTSRIYAPLYAPELHEDIERVVYVALAPQGESWTSSYVRVLNVNLPESISFIGSEDNLVVSVSSSYDGSTFYMGTLDYVYGSDWETTRAYFYLLPTISENYVTYDMLAFYSYVNANAPSATGYQNGYNAGTTNGYNNGYADGFGAGKTEGYTEGLNDKNVTSFTETLVYIFQAPFDQIYRFFNFNILGVNILALACSLITIGLVVFVVKKLK